jgi:protein CpxP
MKSFRFRLLVAALAIVLGSVVAKSQTTNDAPSPPMHGHHGFGMGGPMMGFFAKQLNLTDDQKTQMKAIMEKEKPTMQTLRQQERQIDQQLRQYVEGPYDATKVQALAAQKGQIETQLAVNETRIHNELYQLLTPDQQSQLKQMEANHQARMQKHMNQAPPPPAQ